MERLDGEAAKAEMECDRRCPISAVEGSCKKSSMRRRAMIR